MKNKMTRIIALVIAIIMVASFMVACQGSGGKNTVEERRSTTRPNKDKWGRPWVDDGIGEDVYFADNNQNAETVRLFTRDDSGSGSDGSYLLLEFKGNESANAVMQDAILARNDEVENKLGVSLEIVAEPGLMDGNGSEQQWLNKLMAAALNENGNDLFDIAAIYASQGSALATRGCYLDVNLLPEGTINLDKVWWNQTLQEELEIDGALFMLGGDISLSSSAFANAIFFNKNMFTEYFSKDETFQSEYDWVSHDEEGVTLYDIVNDDAWSISVLDDLASKIYVDSGNPGKDSNDTYGMVINKSSSPLDAWIAALQIQIISKNNSTGEIKLAFAEVDGALDHANRAYRKVSDLLNANRGVYAFADEREGAVDKFAEGDAMFVMCRLCDAETFRNIGDWEYGILPLPKYESGVGEYYTLPHNSYSLIVVAANLDNDRAEMVGYTLELLAAESYRQVTPAYYNTVLKSDYSDRPEDADMYDLVIRNIKMDFATIFSTKSLESIASPIRMQGKSFSESWQTSHKLYEDALKTLVEGLKEQAEKQRSVSN